MVSAAVLGLFFAPALLPDLQFLHRDSGRMHHPMKRWIASELAQGRLPEWNPYAGLGTPVIAGGIDAVLHPFTALTVFLPFDLGFKLWILLSYLLAALGGWYWGRRLGLRDSAAAVVGLGFALSGYMVSTSDNATYLTTMAALPLAFAAAHAWFERGTPGRLALLALASGLCAAGGDPQAWAFFLLALPVYAAVMIEGVPLRAVAPRAALAIAAAVVGAAPWLFPVLAWVPESSRGESFDWVEYVRYNMLPLRLVELVVPHLFHDPSAGTVSTFYQTYAKDPWTPMPWVASEYVGASAFALAALAAVRRRQARWALLAAGLFAWMALGHHAGFGQIARHLPFLGNVRYWEKAAVWIGLLVPLGAAFGIATLAAEPRLGRRFGIACAGAGLLLLGGAALGAAYPEALARAIHPGDPATALDAFPESFGDPALAAKVFAARLGDPADAARILASNLVDGLTSAGAALALLGLVAFCFQAPALATAAPALATLLVIGDLAAANARAYFLSPTALAYLDSPFGDELRARPGLPRVVTPFDPQRLRLAELSPAEQEAAWGSRALGSGWSTVRRVANFESYTALWPVRAARYRRRAGLVKQLPGVGLWGVSHTVIPERLERASEMNLRPPFDVVAADPLLDAFLVEIPHRPRAYLAREVVSVDRRRAMEFALDDGSVSGGRTVVEGPVPSAYAPPDGEVRIALDEPAQVRVEVRASAPGLLVLNDIHAAGWTADLDGAPAEILPANYLARGVWFPAGAHAVTFRYRTRHLYTGWALLALGSAALAAWAWRAKGRASAEAP